MVAVASPPRGGAHPHPSGDGTRERRITAGFTLRLSPTPDVVPRASRPTSALVPLSRADDASNLRAGGGFGGLGSEVPANQGRPFTHV